MFGILSNGGKRREIEREKGEELKYLSNSDVDLIYRCRNDYRIKKLYEIIYNSQEDIENSKFFLKEAIDIFDDYGSKIYTKINGGGEFNQRSKELKKELFGFLGGGYNDKKKIERYFYTMSELLDEKVFSYPVKINIKFNFLTRYISKDGSYPSYYFPIHSYRNLIDKIKKLIDSFIEIRKSNYYPNIKKGNERQQEIENREEKNKIDNLQYTLDRVPEVSPPEQKRYYQIMNELTELEKIVKQKQWDKLNTTEKEDFVLRGGGLDG